MFLYPYVSMLMCPYMSLYSYVFMSFKYMAICFYDPLKWGIHFSPYETGET